MFFTVLFIYWVVVILKRKNPPYHIGQYDKTNNTFKGDEGGAYPWLPVNKSFNIYNVDLLGSFVTLKQPF